MDITFSVETDVFGQTQEVKLKEDGNNILVTDENKVGPTSYDRTVKMIHSYETLKYLKL